MRRKILSGLFFAIAFSLGQPLAFSSSLTSDEGIWAALKSGGYVVLMRHAITEPGIGDPPGFTLEDCSTQRNLSAQGRIDAQHIGEAFRRRGIPVNEVLSSRWCRCLETANLAFGRVTPVPMLDSMFNESGMKGEEKIRQVFAAAKRRPSSANLVFVTHNQNILALTGLSVASGEMVITVPEGEKKLRVIGRLNIAR
ncbi:MAG: histidine phosphatase family protein [Herbaspirillum sp.]|nr:histidine phosphatase family protein [Herbaspirillum sp.]